MSSGIPLLKLSQRCRQSLGSLLGLQPPLAALLRRSPPPPPPPPLFPSTSGRLCYSPIRSLASTADGVNDAGRSERIGTDGNPPNSPPPPPSASGLDYPTGEFEMEGFGWWRRLVVKLRLFFALPWVRVEKGSVLKMQLRGKVRFLCSCHIPVIPKRFTILETKIDNGLDEAIRVESNKISTECYIPTAGQVMSMLKERLGQKKKKKLLMVDYR
ncbi:hypothetical protein BHM03_00002188 [Ensete ventricosum]|nr:hypothetical protein BHM03_00002188 [Ensete ventricosum]